MTKIFYDTETTGLDPRMHSIHQIAGLVEMDGLVVDTFDIKMRPHPRAEITPGAMKSGNVTAELIQSYPLDQSEAKTKFEAMLTRYVNKYDSRDKIHLYGYNNRSFDDPFLERWFELCGDGFLRSWFWNDTKDVLVLAGEVLAPIRHLMPSFKLKRVAKTLGIFFDEAGLHDAAFDAQLTYDSYNALNNLPVHENDVRGLIHNII